MLTDPITPLTPGQEETDLRETRQEGYFWRCLVAFDIFCNVVLFFGLEDETISSHAARAAKQGRWWGLVLTQFLCWIQPDHGAHAEAGDLERAKQVEATEDSTGTLPEK